MTDGAIKTSTGTGEYAHDKRKQLAALSNDIYKRKQLMLSAIRPK